MKCVVCERRDYCWTWVCRTRLNLVLITLVVWCGFLWAVL